MSGVPDIRPGPPLRMPRAETGLTELLGRGPRRSTRQRDLAADAAFVVGGLLLVWSASIHAHLWDTGYRSIPTIGPLFLVQTVAGLVVGVGVGVLRRLWAALVGAGFALATLAGFLTSVAHGLFGFKDSWLAPFARQAFGVEVAAAVLLVLAAVLCLPGSPSRVQAASAPSGPVT